MYNDVDESSQMLARCQRVQRVFSTKRLAHSQSNKPLPPSKWTNLQYRREFFEAAEKALGLQNKEQWYLISASQVRELGGYRLLLLYGNSLAKALADTFPEHNWQFYRFLASPVKERATPQQPKYENMTEAVKEHRQVFEEFARDKKITTFDDWYGVTWHAIKKWDKNQMYPIIRRYYDNSLPKALQVLFPEHEWLPWKFSRTATNYWSSIDNCRHYLSRLALELGISSMEQWYSLTKEHIVNYDGRGLLDHFNDSVAGMLMATFPKHEWKPWLFVYVPRHTWDYILSDTSNKSLSEFVNFVEKGLNIKQRSDWYRISQHQLEEMGALYVVRKSGGLYRLLCRVYPEHRWSRERLSHRTKKAEQHALTEHLSDLKLAE